MKSQRAVTKNGAVAASVVVLATPSRNMVKGPFTEVSMVGRMTLAAAFLAAITFIGCGQNLEGANVRRGLLRSTSVPRTNPEGGKLRPAHPVSPDGSPGRGFLK